MNLSYTMKHNQDFDYDSVKLLTASTEIRLLELFPSEAHHLGDTPNGIAGPIWGDCLVCRLYTVPIQKSSNSFMALSYVWGNDSKSRAIWTVGAPGETSRQWTETSIPITESLEVALRHLRRQHESVTLWIDQICINQADNSEKSKQVEIMGRIYSQAKKVLVWLGQAADNSDELMDAWQNIGQQAHGLELESYLTRERYHLLSPIMLNENPADQATIHFQALLARTADVFAPLIKCMALKKWFERPYFSRAWIVQEFSLCTETSFVCGTKAISVELTKLALLNLQFAISNTFRSDYKMLQGPEMPLERLDELSEEPLSRLFSCRSLQQKRVGDQLFMLLRKLFVGRETHATVHRDRVFALLGLAVDADRLGIQPDYNLSEGSTERILTQTARALIEESGRVDTLCYSQFPKLPDLASLPSWVPDWRSNLRPSFYTVNERADRHIFSAAGENSVVEPSLALNHDLNILGLRGYMVDLIERVATGDAWMDLSWDHVRYLGFFAQVDELWQCSMKKTYPIHGKLTDRRKEEARWRLPIGDIYWTVERGSQRATPDVAIYHEQCLKNLQHFDEMSRKTSSGDGEWAEWKERRQRGQIGQYYRDSMQVMQGKRPFLTQMGYLGMGPAEGKPGDVVVIFCGGRVPYILRPSHQLDGAQRGEHRLFSFVGEAYCDGVMDGEVTTRSKETFFLI
ncbi:het-6or heterokaryon incompatibility het-6or allele [Fusarium longipes]|uniref:Het-6or heterokaryon incompatibility het-6or allele n=1 Tax=Fusarium longipes TaxID=694270 RepID=A0A395T995_9HYPO|nr:het-6or heterokaryon incompatibility het-6or allele [Fusarium longipes]